MKNIIVHEIKKHEIKKICQMLCLLYKHLNSKGFILSLDEKNIEKIILKQLNSNLIKIFVLVVNDKITGFINIAISNINSKFISDKSDYIGYITELFVLEEARGNKYSKLLLDEAFDYFKEKGALIVQVNTMKSNTDAIITYKNSGFEDTTVAFTKIL